MATKPALTRSLFRTAACFLAAACCSPASAQQDAGARFPSKPIRMVVGFAAGGATDIFARLLAPMMFRDSGQPVIVENRPGAGSIIGAEFVARSAPDGHTLLMGPITTLAANSVIYARLPYAPKDFAPVTILSSSPYILVAGKASGVRNMRELLEYAKASPNKANAAGASPGIELVKILFTVEAKVPFEYVGYKSTTESVAAVMSGQVLMTLSDAPALTAPLRAGSVVGIAVSSQKRMAAFPDMPTMAELGLDRIDMLSLNTIVAPAGTPPAVVQRLQEEFSRLLRLPDVQEKLAGLASEPVGSTVEEFRRVMAKEIERWTMVSKVGNFKPIQ